MHQKTSEATKAQQQTVIQNQISAIRTLIRIIFGRTKFTDLGLEEVVIAKACYQTFALVSLLPNVIVPLVYIFSVPQLYQCSSVCTEVYLELEIAFFVFVAYYVAIESKIIMLTFGSGPVDDKHGIVAEMMVITFVGAPSVVVTIAVAMADPGALAYDRKVNWQCLSLVTFLATYVSSFAMPMCRAWTSNQARMKDSLNAAKSRMLNNMVNSLQENADIREEFHEYAVETFIIESVQFIETVCEFKRHFYTKTDTWRTSKVKLLVRTYIAVGSNQEVNISHRTRDKILVRLQHIDISAYDMFDQAFGEVVEMIQNGRWRDFMRARLPHSALSSIKGSPL